MKTTFWEKNKRTLCNLILVAVLVALVGGFNFLFAHWGVTVLFSRGDTQFTLESLIYGCFQGGIFAGVVLWLAVFGRVLGSTVILSRSTTANSTPSATPNVNGSYTRRRPLP